jgi:hypothetical protein
VAIWTSHPLGEAALPVRVVLVTVYEIEYNQSVGQP